MAVTTTTVALGKWANRSNLKYQPCNNPVNGRKLNAFGLQLGDGAANMLRRPYKVDEQGSVAYVMYEDDSRTDVPIFRIVEA